MVRHLYSAVHNIVDRPEQECWINIEQSCQNNFGDIVEKHRLPENTNYVNVNFLTFNFLYCLFLNEETL